MSQFGEPAAPDPADPAGSGDDGIPVLTDVVLSGAPATLGAATVTALANTQRMVALDGNAAAKPLDATQKLQPLTSPSTPADSQWAPPSVYPTAAVTPVPTPAPTQGAITDATLDELSLRIQSRVLGGLMTRIDPVVDQRLREALTDLLEQVLAGMTAELKVTARRIVRDAVAQAVARELAALHKSNFPPS